MCTNVPLLSVLGRTVLGTDLFNPRCWIKLLVRNQSHQIDSLSPQSDSYPQTIGYVLEGTVTVRLLVRPVAPPLPPTRSVTSATVRSVSVQTL